MIIIVNILKHDIFYSKINVAEYYYFIYYILLGEIFRLEYLASFNYAIIRFI